MSDLIDRQTAQRLFRKAISFKEYVGKMLWSTSEVKEWVAEFIEDLPSASTKLSNNLPKPDNENGELIYRQDAIDAIREWKTRMTVEGLVDHILALPSAQPRKKGKWINKKNIYGVAYCSECDYELHTNDTNFCPHCGADMREGEEE